MPLPRHIDPDHFLETPNGRVWNDERGKAAWDWAYAELQRVLEELGARAALYVACGLQGSGKSTWIERNHGRLGADAVFFDAALPASRHRVRAIELARRFGARTVAIFIATPIETALSRNAQRQGDYRIPDQTIWHVHDQLQPPTRDEGFDDVIFVTDG